jgi:O-methyltransferase
VIKKIGRVLLKCLNLIGFAVVRFRQNDYGFSYESLLEKYRASIAEIENLYREFLFNDLSSSNEARTSLVSNLLGTQPGEAMYLLNYLNKSMLIEGDICEFGIAQGATSALLANEIKESQKAMWLFDSFKGLPKPTEKDKLIHDIFNLGTMAAYEGTMASGVDSVLRRLEKIGFPSSRVNIVPGFIENTISNSRLPEKVAFAYIDFDFYKPILIALNYLDKSLQPGGYVIVDDYGYFSSGAKTAVDEFLATNKDRYSFFLPIKAAGYFCIIQRLS